MAVTYLANLGHFTSKGFPALLVCSKKLAEKQQEPWNSPTSPPPWEGRNEASTSLLLLAWAQRFPATEIKR